MLTSSFNKNIQLDWFVVKTKSRCEKRVAQQMRDDGYEVYLPLIESIRLWSDRKKKVQLPLISTILFVQDPTCSKNAIYSNPNVHSILKLQGKIAHVKPHEIEQLKIMVDEKLEFNPGQMQDFRNGEEVQIIGGPLNGHFAIAIEEVSNYRILLEISALGIGYCVNIAKNKLKKLK